MKLRLNKEEKAALLVAVSKGELDTAKIPRLYKEIRGNNDFLDMLMQLDMEDEEEPASKEIGWKTVETSKTGGATQALPVCCIWKPQQRKDFAVSGGMTIFVPEKPAKGDKLPFC